MKTFKLKSLIIVKNVGELVEKKNVPLIDGLIINREDKDDHWLIEAYVDAEHEAYFRDLQQKEEIMIEVKITKETNDPASFITSITGLNMIGNKMNVLFIGKMADLRRGKAHHILEKLIHDGYEGTELIELFQKEIEGKE